MELTQYVNKIIYGHELNSWNYDYSMPYEDLVKIGYPHSMACFNLNDKSIIAVDVGDEAPRFFPFNNDMKEFVLDASLHPRNIESMRGNKNVFYLKEYNGNFKKNEKTQGQFKINCFKENGNLCGAPEPGRHSLAMIDIAFLEIKKKLNKIRDGIEIHNLIEEEIGSLTIEVNFLNNKNDEPNKYNETIFKSKGFSFPETIKIIQDISDNM